MKKILIILMMSLSIFVVGCQALNNTPIARVEELLSKYQTLDESVINDLNASLENTTYTEEQKDRYKEIMKEQYKTLTYKIKEDTINGDDAIVTVSIMVKDYYKALREANTYFASHTSEFLENGNYTTKFNDYKLDKLEDVKEKVTYTMDITLSKVNGKWVVDDLSDEALNKINGIYAY